MLFDQAMFVRSQTIAKLYANCSMVPDHFKGKMENCFIALQLAVRTGQDPFMLMQNMYIVHGRPGFEAKYTIGQLNSSGKIKGLVKYVFSGAKGTDDYGCTAVVTEASTDEKIEGPKVDWRMVKAEGWDKDKGGRDGKPVQKSKWNTMPEMMFRYRAAAFLIRTTFPEVLMGMQTREELEDTTIDVVAEEPRKTLRDRVKQVAQESSPEAETIEEIPFSPPTEAEQAEAQAILGHETAPLAESSAPPEVTFDADAWANDFIGLVSPGTRMKERPRLRKELADNRARIGEERWQRCTARIAESNWDV